MKKIINDPSTVLDEMNRGFATAYADIVELHDDPLYVPQGRCRAGQGGRDLGRRLATSPRRRLRRRGHAECRGAGCVLQLADPDQILAATQAADGGAGVLHLILNYTGDILNFETGAELAELEEIPVKTVVIDDDVAVENSTYTAGRRGVAGAIVAFKLASAAADRGDDLENVTRIAAKANDNMATMGLAMTACTVPTVGKPSFELGEDEMELGIGVHGEPGVKRVPMMKADDIVDLLLEKVLDDLKLESGENVLLYINGLGATPLSEQYILYNHAHDVLTAKGINVIRSQIGNFFTSLEMSGASLTVMRLDDELTELYDAPVRTAGWRAGA